MNIHPFPRTSALFLVCLLAYFLYFLVSTKEKQWEVKGAEEFWVDLDCQDLFMCITSISFHTPNAVSLEAYKYVFTSFSYEQELYKIHNYWGGYIGIKTLWKAETGIATIKNQNNLYPLEGHLCIREYQIGMLLNGALLLLLCLILLRYILTTTMGYYNSQPPQEIFYCERITLEEYQRQSKEVTKRALEDLIASKEYQSYMLNSVVGASSRSSQEDEEDYQIALPAMIRTLAFVIDFVLSFPTFVIIYLHRFFSVGLLVEFGSPIILALIVVCLLLNLINVFYFFKGQTIGKCLCGLRVVTSKTNKAASPLRMFLREWIAKPHLVMFDAAFVILSNGRTSLSDILLNTTVVCSKRPGILLRLVLALLRIGRATLLVTIVTIPIILWNR